MIAIVGTEEKSVDLTDVMLVDPLKLFQASGSVKIHSMDVDVDSHAINLLAVKSHGRPAYACPFSYHHRLDGKDDDTLDLALLLHRVDKDNVVSGLLIFFRRDNQKVTSLLQEYHPTTNDNLGHVLGYIHPFSSSSNKYDKGIHWTYRKTPTSKPIALYAESVIWDKVSNADLVARTKKLQRSLGGYIEHEVMCLQGEHSHFILVLPDESKVDLTGMVLVDPHWQYKPGMKIKIDTGGYASIKPNPLEPLLNVRMVAKGVRPACMWDFNVDLSEFKDDEIQRALVIHGDTGFVLYFKRSNAATLFKKYGPSKLGEILGYIHPFHKHYQNEYNADVVWMCFNEKDRETQTPLFSERVILNPNTMNHLEKRQAELQTAFPDMTVGCVIGRTAHTVGAVAGVNRPLKTLKSIRAVTNGHKDANEKVISNIMVMDPFDVVNGDDCKVYVHNGGRYTQEIDESIINLRAVHGGGRPAFMWDFNADTSEYKDEIQKILIITGVPDGDPYLYPDGVVLYFRSDDKATRALIESHSPSSPTASIGHILGFMHPFSSSSTKMVHDAFVIWKHNHKECIYTEKVSRSHIDNAKLEQRRVLLEKALGGSIVYDIKDSLMYFSLSLSLSFHVDEKENQVLTTGRCDGSGTIDYDCRTQS